MPHTLVPSDRVEHANVYGQDGAKLGTIERLMLDKTSGTVAYAVIKTGGMLASHHHYPVRWDALKFDPARQAFVVELTLEDLRAGPSEFDEDDFDWGHTRIIGRCRTTAVLGEGVAFPLTQAVIVAWTRKQKAPEEIRGSVCWSVVVRRRPVRDNHGGII